MKKKYNLKRLKDEELYEIGEVLNHTGLSETTFWRIRKKYELDNGIEGGRFGMKKIYSGRYINDLLESYRATGLRERDQVIKSFQESKKILKKIRKLKG